MERVRQRPDGLDGRLLAVQGVSLAVMALALAVVPRLVPALLVALGLVSAIRLQASDGAGLRTVVQHPVFVAVAALAAYMACSMLWALAPAAALAKAGVVILLAAAGLCVAADLGRLPPARARRLARWALAGLLAGAGLLLADLLLDQAIWIFIHNELPGLTSTVKKGIVRDGDVIRFAEAFHLNRNVAALAIVLWPAGLLLWRALDGGWRFAGLGLLAALTVATVAISDSQTSMVALGIGALVLAVAHISWRALRAIVAVVWIVGLVLAVPLGALPYKLGWHEWEWLPRSSVAGRFYIWKFTANAVSERPLTGIGARGTRVLQKRLYAEGRLDATNRYSKRPGRHAHNAFLQVWLELGALGAAAVLAVGLAGLWRLGRCSAPGARAGLALFAVCCAVATFGWGIWQTWLLASFALAWSLLAFAEGLGADDQRR